MKQTSKAVNRPACVGAATGEAAPIHLGHARVSRCRETSVVIVSEPQHLPRPGPESGIRIEDLRCAEHAGQRDVGYCADCITVKQDALRQYPDFQDLRPMPEALAEKLGVVPFKDEWRR